MWGFFFFKYIYFCNSNSCNYMVNGNTAAVGYTIIKLVRVSVTCHVTLSNSSILTMSPVLYKSTYCLLRRGFPLVIGQPMSQHEQHNEKSSINTSSDWTRDRIGDFMAQTPVLDYVVNPSSSLENSKLCKTYWSFEQLDMCTKGLENLEFLGSSWSSSLTFCE